MLIGSLDSINSLLKEGINIQDRATANTFSSCIYKRKAFTTEKEKTLEKMDISLMPGSRIPPGGAMDILFSFDTTGSMSYILDEVKGRLSDMIQRLQSDIPGIRIGVIAHGDYCDEEVFYLEKHIDFTQDVTELCQFVGEVEGTGGGDQDECYELILRKANEVFTWAPVSNKVLVMIGDANPHEPDYKLNVDRINWRDEVSLLAKQGIKIYAVQALNNDGVEDFYRTMAEETRGHYLKLENFSNICDFIMAICYRERDDDLFMNYEAEVAARQGTSGLHQDLNKMFATLRREDSDLSCKSGTSKLDRVTFMPSLSSSFSSNGNSINMSGPRSATPENPAPLSPLPMTPLKHIASSPVGVKRIAKPRQLRQNPKKKSQVDTFQREMEPETKFKLRKLNWTSWKLAYSPEKPDDTRQWCKMYRMDGYRRKTLFSRSVDQKLYEVSVQTHPRGKLHVMYSTITASDLNESRWSKNLFPGSRRRHYIHCRQIKRVLQQGCRVFVRKVDIKKGQMKQVDNLNKYSYAWTRSISGVRKPERTVVKDNKILSGMDYE